MENVSWEVSFFSYIYTPNLKVSYKIIVLLRNTRNIKSFAEDANLSANTVIRLLDTVKYSSPNSRLQ